MLRSLLILVTLSPAASAAELTTLKGLKYTGDFVTLAEGNVSFSTPTGPITISVKEIATIDFNAKSDPLVKAKYDEIELIDGSMLRVTGLEIPGKAVKPAFITGEPMLTVNLPLDNLFYVVRNANDTKTREDWQKLLKSRGKRDLFVIKQNDLLSPVPGTILTGDVAGTGVEFERETDSQKVNFKLTRATGGLVFNQPPRGVIPPTLCRLSDTLGNVLTVQSLGVVNKEVVVKTVSGATFTYPSIAAIAKLDFSTGNVAYLSDMEPIVNAPMAAPGEPAWSYLKDKTPDGPGFKLAGTAYARGLWIAPDVTLVYKLNADYREFKAILGVDDGIPVATSAVKLTIEADGKVVFSEVIVRKEKPKELTLDVKNVKLLKIIVEPEGLFLGNQIDLAEARLQK
ncbi:hypothetical protein BH11PLA2_BH11PLA2_35200 [soil metagenome]